MKKQLTAIAGVLIIAGAGAGLATSTVHADTATTNMSQSQSTSTKKHMGHWRIRLSARLNQAERDGVITSVQKTSLRTELQQLRSERKADGITKASTTVAKTAEHTKLKNELKAWATTNNFPLAKLAPKLAS